MSRPIHQRGKALSCAILVCLGPGALACAGHDDTTLREVRAVLERQQSDWNRGDLDGFLTSYWKSPRVVFLSGGTRSEGWQALHDRYHRRYKSEGKAMGILAFSGLEVEILGLDSAFVRGGWRLSLPDGSKPAGLFTVILRRFPDGWKIVHDHTSAEDAPKKGGN